MKKVRQSRRAKWLRIKYDSITSTGEFHLRLLPPFVPHWSFFTAKTSTRIEQTLLVQDFWWWNHGIKLLIFIFKDNSMGNPSSCHTDTQHQWLKNKKQPQKSLTIHLLHQSVQKHAATSSFLGSLYRSCLCWGWAIYTSFVFTWLENKSQLHASESRHRVCLCFSNHGDTQTKGWESWNHTKYYTWDF